ncbi:MAG: hypothetical protein AAGF12_43810, partial [Myxococcota bacterium]
PVRSEQSPGTRSVTAYAIQFEPQYAQAVELMPGCTPVGASPFGSSAAFFSTCGSARNVALLADAAQERNIVGEAEPVVECEAGRPKFLLAGDTEALGGAREGIEHLLPDRVAGPRSKAIWTGEAILVASPRGNEVVVNRYECVENQLSSTSSP